MTGDWAQPARERIRKQRTAKRRPIKCVIVSHKRAGRVTTHRAVANCWLSCAESQADEYANKHPELADRILAHPDNIGSAGDRSWVLDNCGDHIQLDDDSICMMRTYQRPNAWKKTRMNPQLAYEVIQHCGDTARQMGTYLFGFSKHKNPIAYSGLQPFKLGVHLTGQIGILAGGRLFIPAGGEAGTDASLVEDYWLSLLNAHYSRYMWLDLRFSFSSLDDYANAGGCAEFRGQRADGRWPAQLGTEYLQRNFGDVVRPAKLPKNNVLTKQDKNIGRRELVFPYNYV